MKNSLLETYKSDKFKDETAGYIDTDGSFIYAEEYHGEEDNEYKNLGLPEFSSTHYEEDTCVRIYKEPNEIQYKKLEEIIDYFLDTYYYCKVEIWDKPNKKYSFYNIYSLFEGACKDYTWNEKVGNWTGYKLIQIIKNNINKKNLDEAYNTGNVNGKNIFDTSTLGGYSYYSQCIPGDPENEYMKVKHNRIGKIIQMSPNEYYSLCAEMFGLTVENLKRQRMLDEDEGYMDNLKDVILKDKKQFPMTFISLPDKQQEGLHRMLVAGELFGWDEKFPVLIIRKNDPLKEELLSKYIETKKFKPYTTRYVKEDLNEVFDLNKYINDRFSNNLYSFPVDGPSYITPNGQFIDIIGIAEDMGDDFPEDFPCHGAIQTIMSLEGKADKGGYYDDGSPLLRKNGYIRVNDIEQENNYIELSNIKPTYDQYIALEKWLDHNSHKYSYVTILTEQFKNHQEYSYSEYITDDIVKKIKRYYTTGRLVEDVKDKLDCFLTEKLLLELNRNQLINKSKHSDNYKDQSKGRNRWERRNHSKIDRRVDQYNKIDMNSFFKKDELKVGINVHGETDDYIVTIRFNNALKAIADEIKRNNNKLEFKCVLIALQRTFNNGDVFVSCTCADFKYRIAFQATKGGYNSGTPELRASNITNPHDTKGAGCKHINLVIGNIDWVMKIASVINNYIHYMEEHYQRLYADVIFPRLFNMPYQRAVQLNLFDTGTDKLDSEEDEIKLSNRYGRTRGQFRSDVRINNMRNFRGPQLQQSQEVNNKPLLQQNVSNNIEKDQ